MNPCPGVMQAEDVAGVTTVLYGFVATMSTPSGEKVIPASQNWAAIRALAPDRFDAYARPGDTDGLDAVARYAWNMAVSAAIQCPLHILEVSFRNHVHNELARLHGEDWYDAPRLLGGFEAQKVAEAKTSLARQKRQATPGRIVAELSFGFWTALYGSDHEVNIVRPTIHRVFSCYSGSAPLKRNVVAAPLREARLLRNRLSHYEHVVFDPNLPHQYQVVLDLVAWMSPHMSAMATMHDNFLTVYGNNWTVFRQPAELAFGALVL